MNNTKNSKLNNLVSSNEGNYQIPRRILLQQEKQRKAYEDWLNGIGENPFVKNSKKENSKPTITIKEEPKLIDDEPIFEATPIVNEDLKNKENLDFVKEANGNAQVKDEKPIKEKKPNKFFSLFKKREQVNKEEYVADKFLYIPYNNIIQNKITKQLNNIDKFLYEEFKPNKINSILVNQEKENINKLTKEKIYETKEEKEKPIKVKLEETKEDYPKSKFLYIPYDRLLKGKKLREIKGIKKFLYDPLDDSFDDVFFHDDNDDFNDNDNTKYIDDSEVINSYDENNVDVLLDVKNLTKVYSSKAKPAIDKISFQVKRGEFHAFIGANGAGKTTTIKSIVGAYANYLGEIKIGNIINKNKESKAKLGYIPEIARFPARISSYNYLKEMAMLNRLTKQEAEVFVNDILNKFNMQNLKKVSPNKFSSGQKKKILLAQALSNNPDLLIMDEPTANLDPKARIEFFDILKDLQKQGKSIFISSHILTELDIYADTVTILDGGKIVFSGKRNLASLEYENTYKITLKNEGDFGGLDISKINLVQDVENKNEYIVSASSSEILNDFIANLFKLNKLHKSQEYKLSIEEMYKKYVIKGSVHTAK